MCCSGVRPSKFKIFISSFHDRVLPCTSLYTSTCWREGHHIIISLLVRLRWLILWKMTILNNKLRYLILEQINSLGKRLNLQVWSWFQSLNPMRKLTISVRQSWQIIHKHQELWFIDLYNFFWIQIFYFIEYCINTLGSFAWAWERATVARFTDILIYFLWMVLFCKSTGLQILSWLLCWI